MKCKSKPYTKVEREYLITSAEIKKALEIEGEIQSIGVSSGRNPDDIEQGISADRDEWYVKTIQQTAKRCKK